MDNWISLDFGAVASLPTGTIQFEVWTSYVALKEADSEFGTLLRSLYIGGIKVNDKWQQTSRWSGSTSMSNLYAITGETIEHGKSISRPSRIGATTKIKLLFQLFFFTSGLLMFVIAEYRHTFHENKMQTAIWVDTITLKTEVKACYLD